METHVKCILLISERLSLTIPPRKYNRRWPNDNLIMITQSGRGECVCGGGGGGGGGVHSLTGP